LHDSSSWLGQLFGLWMMRVAATFAELRSSRPRRLTVCRDPFSDDETTDGFRYKEIRRPENSWSRKKPDSSRSFWPGKIWFSWAPDLPVQESDQFRSLAPKWTALGL